MRFSDIRTRLSDLRRQEWDERAELLKDHNEKFSKLRSDIIRDCGEIGHVKGKFHDNGWGCCWFYCGRCGGRMEDTVETYSILRDDDE